MAKARADYIIGELQRKAGKRPLLILMTSTHPMTDRNICKTGHQFYNLDIPNFPVKWQREGIEVPENMHIISSVEELPHRPDIILSQNVVDQYNIWVQISQQFDCPVLCFEHTLPSPEWEKQGIPAKLVGDLAPNTRAFITDFSRKEWGCEEVENAFIIRHMVDTNYFSGWEGGNGKAMCLVNAFANRKWAVGDLDELFAIDQGENIILYGHNPGYASQHLSGQNLIRALREHDVFVNTSLRSPIPASLLEAASIGMPIVTTATCEIPTFFKDGENCLVFETYEECVEKTKELLGDRKLRKQLGAAARETILEHFNEERYVADWDNVLEFTMERHHE